jgi:hypothetical protein
MSYHTCHIHVICVSSTHCVYVFVPFMVGCLDGAVAAECGLSELVTVWVHEPMDVPIPDGIDYMIPTLEDGLPIIFPELKEKKESE